MDHLYDVDLDDGSPAPSAPATSAGAAVKTAAATAVPSDTAATADASAAGTAGISGSTGHDIKVAPLLVIVGIIAAVAYMFWPMVNDGDAVGDLRVASAESPNPASEGTIRTQVGVTLEQAAATWLDTPADQRTFETFIAPAGWLYVGTPATLQVGAVFGDVCAIGQIDGTVFGTPVYVGIDESRQACDPAFMDQLRLATLSG